jgi:purine nucleoside permease
VFQLNEALLRRAHALSRDVPLADSAQAQAARSKFTHAPAHLPPSVLQCDTASADTWFSGTLLVQRARDWTRILTDGRGVFCTAQQEDNAIYEALKRGASAKLLDLDRVAVLRAGSDFLRPYDGQSSADNLLNYAAQGGFAIALENLYRTGSPLVQQIVNNWRQWRRGVPAH